METNQFHQSKAGMPATAHHSDRTSTATGWRSHRALFLAVAGAADVISAVFRGTILQLQVPDRLRGRLNALNIAVVTGGPRLGDLEAGVVASATNAQVSVVSGGLACIAGVALLARVRPELGDWRAPDTLDQIT